MNSNDSCKHHETQSSILHPTSELFIQHFFFPLLSSWKRKVAERSTTWNHKPLEAKLGLEDTLALMRENALLWCRRRQLTCASLVRWRSSKKKKKGPLLFFLVPWRAERGHAKEKSKSTRTGGRGTRIIMFSSVCQQVSTEKTVTDGMRMRIVVRLLGTWAGAKTQPLIIQRRVPVSIETSNLFPNICPIRSSLVGAD